MNTYSIDFAAGTTTSDWSFDSAELVIASSNGATQTSWSTIGNGGTLVFEAEDSTSVQVKINATAGTNRQFDGDVENTFSITESGTADIQNITIDATVAEYIITFNTTGALSDGNWALTVEATTQLVLSSINFDFGDYTDALSQFDGGVDGANFPITVPYTLTNVPLNTSPAAPGSVSDTYVSGANAGGPYAPTGKGSNWTGNYEFTNIANSNSIQTDSIEVTDLNGNLYDAGSLSSFFYTIDTSYSPPGGFEEEADEGGGEYSFG
jgi:hypothetical protein